MKKVIYSFLAFSMLFISCSEEAETEISEAESIETSEATENAEEEVMMVDGYAYYGIEELTPEGAITMNEMQAQVDSLGSFEGKISAKLSAVCQKAGCWVMIENPGKQPMRVFFGAHDFFIPIDTEVGKEVILSGHTDIDTFTVEFQKHLLEDEIEAGNEVSQEDFDAITEDKLEMSFIATGILIKP